MHSLNANTAANVPLASTTEGLLAARIMILDDEPLNVKVLRKYLEIAGYRNFITTNDSTQALDVLRREKPDVLLSDVMMPQVSGLEILSTVRSDPALAYLPVLILTASTDVQIRRQALELGATDFLNKPVEPAELVPRVRNALVVKAHHDYLAGYSEKLEREVRIRTVELEASRLRVVHCLARAAEYRDDDTGRHVIRVGRYAGIIARELGLAEPHAAMLEVAAQLHDVGKIGMPDAILLKAGPLSEDEFSFMRRHCEYGLKIISPVPEQTTEAQRMQANLGLPAPTVYEAPILTMAGEIAISHHEKWDGSGYPRQRRADQIPLEGRITAVADVFDALSSKRPYKQPMPLEKALAILEQGRGKHFDPTCVGAFLARLNDILQVQQQLKDAA